MRSGTIGHHFALNYEFASTQFPCPDLHQPPRRAPVDVMRVEIHFGPRKNSRLKMLKWIRQCNTTANGCLNTNLDLMLDSAINIAEPLFPVRPLMASPNFLDFLGSKLNFSAKLLGQAGACVLPLYNHGSYFAHCRQIIGMPS